MAPERDDHSGLSQYASDEFAEFYDFWIDDSWPPPFEDIETYWEAIQSLVAVHSERTDPITVVEIGAGTARVLKDLLKRARDQGIPLTNVKIYQTDPEQVMLRRGEKFLKNNPELARIAPVHWAVASGETFTSVLPGLKASTDLVIWTGGGFSHILSEEGQFAFLQQVEMALRPRSSTATCILSVLNQSIPSKNPFLRGDFSVPDAGKIFERPFVAQSNEQSGLTYRKFPNEVMWDGKFRHDRFTLQLERASDEAEPEKIEMETSLMNFDEDGWPGLVEKAGLRIAHVKEYSVGRFYYLERMVDNK